MVKKPLFYKIAAGSASLGILFVPFLALANPFSISSLLSGFGTPANAESNDISNSQRMALLSPATNLDPNPVKNSTDLPVEGDEALAASIGPSGTTADVEEMPTTSQITVYPVHAGDTLSSIAKMFGVSVNTILGANDIKGGVIHEGDQLIILPITGIRHTTTLGETLQSLAKKYGSDPNDIAQYNGLDSAAPLTAGTTLLIPNGELPAVVPNSAGNSPSKSSSGSSGTSKTGSKSSSGTTGSKSSGKSSSKTGEKTSTTGSVSKSNAAPGSANEPYLGGSGPAVAGFGWPIAGGQITQGLHGWNAVDIGAPTGTDIYAAMGGTVIIAKDNGGWNGGYGNYVVISHPNGTQTLYAHMSQVLVSSGDSVSKGDTIGLVGETGDATGPHLHFEVRGAQNPFASLPMGGSE